jgi:formylglycine-generating enzyme required for sulfatase activity
VKLELVYVKEGEFQMGITKEEIDTILREDKDARRENYDDEHPRHKVEITKPFWLGKYAVTQQEFEKIMGFNPSYFSASAKGRDGEQYFDWSKPGGGKDKVQKMETTRFPVENVSWDNASAFCEELNRKHLNQLPEALRQAGYKFRLPTEAQWEYACRAGTETPFHFGKELNGKQANCLGNYPYGTTVKGTYLQRTCRVGSYDANAFGLYDMYGNVYQWCEDYYDPKFYSSGALKDPFNSQKGAETLRVLRGGSWFGGAWYCRAACRTWHAPSIRLYLVGFRVALRLD